MEFIKGKCAMFIMKGGKITKEIELQSQERIRAIEEKENYKYLEILEVDTIKQADMKGRVRKVYLRGIRKLCSRNLIKGINTWAISPL